MPIPHPHLGQHFLCDKAIIQQIVAALAPQESEHLVEIGPGQGALTVPVLKLVNELDAIEFDRDLIRVLQQRTQRFAGFHIHSADALEFDFASLKKDKRLLRIFGNLPYNISTPLLFHVLSYADLIADMLFMLQKEVAVRMTAKPGKKEYGRLSVMVQYHCAVERLFDVPANAFYPPPNVQSGMVHLIPYRDYPYRAKDYSLFQAIVKDAFGQRRKTLRNSLKNWVNDDTWAHIQIHSDLRAENLSVKDFVEISNALGTCAK